MTAGLIYCTPNNIITHYVLLNVQEMGELSELAL
jgi:hypothetical protein